MKSGSALVNATATLLIAVALAGTMGCRPPPEPAPGGSVSLRLGLPVEGTSALAIIALEKGFFAAEGLDVIVSNYVSGARALAGLLADEVDVASSAEVPVVFASFGRQDFRLLATIATAGNIHYIVARKDAGITAPADLRGKRIATQRGSSVHLFLHLFLVRHGLTEQDVRVSFLKAEDLVPALQAGRIDAFSMREPYVTQATEALGEQVVVFHEPRLYLRTDVLASKERFIRDRPEALRRLLRGLRRAEREAEQSPDESIRRVAAKLGIPSDHMAQQWRHLALKLTLNQSLLTQLETEAKWVCDNHLVPETAVPNYLRYVDSSLLEAVAPEAVTIIQ